MKRFFALILMMFIITLVSASSMNKPPGVILPSIENCISVDIGTHSPLIFVAYQSNFENDYIILFEKNNVAEMLETPIISCKPISCYGSLEVVSRSGVFFNEFLFIKYNSNIILKMDYSISKYSMANRQSWQETI